MKKLLIVVVVITLPIITYFQYKNYVRFQAPSDYDYQATNEIDLNYYDQSLVEEYFEKKIEISSFSRRVWRNEGVDVLFPDTNVELELDYSNYYNTLLKRIEFLELKLNQSLQYKQKGFDNSQIQRLEQGISQAVIRNEKFVGLEGSSIGDEGETIWVLQKKLIEKGYEHTLDGVFGDETQLAVIKFQNDNELFPSGVVSRSTLELLFK